MLPLMLVMLLTVVPFPLFGLMIIAEGRMQPNDKAIS